jgi:hypothetical protein
MTEESKLQAQLEPSGNSVVVSSGGRSAKGRGRSLRCEAGAISALVGS